MAKTWIKAASEVPVQEVVTSDLKHSDFVIVFYQKDFNRGFTKGLGIYIHTQRRWVDTVGQPLNVIYWCYIPECTGEMKTLIKEHNRNSKQVTSSQS